MDVSVQRPLLHLGSGSGYGGKGLQQREQSGKPQQQLHGDARQLTQMLLAAGKGTRLSYQMKMRLALVTMPLPPAALAAMTAHMLAARVARAAAAA